MNRQFARLIALGFLLALSLGRSATVSGRDDAYEQPPIDYLNAKVHDPVARLADRIESRETKLDYEETFGYLRSLLRELNISVSSQTLVFSKTSLQVHRISPRQPRAIFFNDEVYVGFCQRGDVIELAATDPRQGATFYTLAQSKNSVPTFVRDRGGCLSCHASSRTQNVPGYLVRSVFADASGRPKLGSGSFTTDHTSDLRDRWGGWYVTGQHGRMRHMGNTLCTTAEHEFDRESGANQTDLSDRFQTATYLTPHSDLVALMVLEHQTQMHNAIAAANYETRQALFQSYEMNAILDRPEGHISESAERRIEAAAEQVLQYLLMVDEYKLTDPVRGSTNFAVEFAAAGPRDSLGRSLRDFDLQTRLFCYPCSYLIHSGAFAGLPEEVRHRVLIKLDDVLQGRAPNDEAMTLTEATRKAIREILLDTLPEFKKICSQRF